MKMKPYLCTAVMSMVVLCGSALGAQQSTSSTTRSRNTPPPADETPIVWRVVRYPFRAGYTIIRTPVIVGETVTGKRTFISEQGLFQTRPQETTERSTQHKNPK